MAFSNLNWIFECMCGRIHLIEISMHNESLVLEFIPQFTHFISNLNKAFLFACGLNSLNTLKSDHG